MNDIHSITLETDETGYTLVVEADFGSVTGALNDLAVMRQLIVAAKYAQSYIDSHDEAFAAWKAHGTELWSEEDYFEAFVDIARTDDRLHQEGLK